MEANETLEARLMEISQVLKAKDVESWNAHYEEMAKLTTGQIKERAKWGNNPFIKRNRDGAVLVLSIVTPDEAKALIETITENNRLSFLAKVGTKLDWIKSLPVASITHSIYNASNYTLKIELFENTHFIVDGAVVHNYSPKGTPFIQYPTRFLNAVVGGKKVLQGEANLKRALSEWKQSLE